jgi:hypothetical protein
VNIVIFKNNKVLKITITTRGGESKQTHSHRRDATQNRIIFDDGYSIPLLLRRTQIMRKEPHT